MLIWRSLFLKLDRKQFSSVTVQFQSVNRSGYFQFYQISFKKTVNFILPKLVAINCQ